MRVELFTVLAQLANFLILVALLKRFLYAPILGIMREREERVAAQVREAQEALALAREQRESGERERATLAASRETLLEEARQVSAEHRRSLESEARLEVAELRRRWHSAVEKEQEAFLLEVRRRTEAESLALARRALEALAGEDLDALIAARFVERLERMQGEAGELPAAGDRVLVRSAHQLPEALSGRLREALSQKAGDGLEVELETDPDLVSGIEVAWRGHKLAWSLRDFLETVEERLQPDTAGPAPSERPGG